MNSKIITTDATVRWIDLEAGFWGLVADDGKKWRPVLLPKEFQKDGLRLQATLKQSALVFSVQMWGTAAELVTAVKI